MTTRPDVQSATLDALAASSLLTVAISQASTRC